MESLNYGEVIMLVTSTNEYFRHRVIPATRTWMKQFVHVFVIFEDTLDIRFQLRFCNHKDYDDFVTAFKCDNEPIYILSRQCTSDYAFSQGICFKVDVLFHFIMKYKQKLFNQMKFITLSDDDTYWRADQFLYWLSLLNKSNISRTVWEKSYF